MGYYDPAVKLTSTWSITMDGALLRDDIMQYLESISINESLYKADQATITFLDPRFKLTDMQEKGGKEYFFKSGRKVEVRLGHKGMTFFYQLRLDKIRHKLNGPDGEDRMILHLLDTSINLHLSRKKPSYSGSLQDIVQEIADAHGLTLYMDKQQEEAWHTVINAGHRTDLQVLQYLAREYGYRVKMKGNVLIFRDRYRELLDFSSNPRGILHYKSEDNTIARWDLMEKQISGIGNANAKKNICGIDKKNDIEYKVNAYHEEKKGTPSQVKAAGKPKEEPKTEQRFFLDERGEAYLITRELPEKKADEKPAETPSKISAKDAIDAQLKAAGLSKAKQHQYDATCTCSFADPLLLCGLRISCQGLGTRMSGLYKIGGRSISMSQSKAPELILYLDKAYLGGNKIKCPDVAKTTVVDAAVNGKIVATGMEDGELLQSVSLDKLGNTTFNLKASILEKVEAAKAAITEIQNQSDKPHLEDQSYDE